MEQPKQQPGRLEKIRTVAGGLAMAVPHTAAYGIRAVARPFRGSRKHPDIAPQLPTPRLLGSVLVDHVITSALQTVFTVDEDYDFAELRREVDTTIERLDAQGWLQDPRGFHQLPPAPADPVLEPARWLHFRYERLSFESGYVSPVEAERADERWNAPPNRNVHAYVLRHRDREPHPWVLLHHGYGAGMPMDFYMGAAHFHRDLGFNVIGPIAPYHGPRRVFRRGGVGMTSLDYVRNLHSLGQAVWDIRRCISWAETQGAGPVACYGVSMGGCLVGLIAGIDDRVGTAVAGIPLVDVTATMRSRSRRGDQWGEPERTGLFGDRLELIHRPVTPLSLVPLVPHERRFIYAGVGDQIIKPGDAYRLWQHWDKPNVLWFRGSHVASSGKAVKRFVDHALMTHPATSSAQTTRKGGDDEAVIQAL